MDSDYQKILDKNGIFPDGKPLGEYFYNIVQPIRQETLKKITLTLEDEILKRIVPEIYCGTRDIRINLDLLLDKTDFNKGAVTLSEIMKELSNWLELEKISYYFKYYNYTNWLEISFKEKINNKT